MVEKTKQAKRLEDYYPGASRKQVLGALSKVVKSPKSNGKGKTSRVQRVIDIVIEKNLDAFKELERY